MCDVKRDISMVFREDKLVCKWPGVSNLFKKHKRLHNSYKKDSHR